MDINSSDIKDFANIYMIKAFLFKEYKYFDRNNVYLDQRAM